MKNKKVIVPLAVILIISLIFNIISLSSKEKPLPKQELSEGLRGVYGIDKNVNETTIDKYLGRSDTVYIDLKMLEDTATWENKGGDRNLTGFIKGFEVVPYPYLTEFPKEYIKQKEEENISGLYTGKTLFSLDKEGNYIPNYEESMDILNSLFPKDKYIFLICGAGGYANFTKQMLVSLGWDSEKIYNLGAYWQYTGSNNIQVEKTIDGKKYYDFWKVPYHDINFDYLRPIKNA